MTIWQLVLVIGLLLAIAIVLIWLALRPHHPHQATSKDGKAPGSAGTSTNTSLSSSFEEASKEDVQHIFDDEFREELKNRGRLHFEKIIGENAMFLQQDLRLTTSQLNEYMKGEITRKLQEEFSKYEQSIMDAKQLAIDSIEKTNAAVDEQRQLLSKQITEQMAAEKSRSIKQFEESMADIVNHYVLSAIGNQIDLSDQLEYILSDLEANKQAILEDITNGS
jgi:hypothetical protein